jgi:hypothetical protein
MDGVRKGAKDYLDSLPSPPLGSSLVHKKWWDCLSDSQRADCIAMHPGVVGALDGLPSEIRDEANRTVLDEAHGEYALKLATIPPPPDDPLSADWTLWNMQYGDEYRRVTGRLKGMDAIQSRFDATGENGMPEAYLLWFDPEGGGHDGKVILTNGNPDTADHTGIYVPGMTTNINDIGKDLGRSDRLWMQSHLQAPGQKVSTVMPRFFCSLIAWGDLVVCPDSSRRCGRGAVA